MTKIIDPYGSELVEDYTKIIKDFGLEIFDDKIFSNPNRIMRRNVVFAGRDLKIISKAIHEKKPFYALSGIMPTSDTFHFGNKMVVENLRYFQELGAKTFILIADLEAAAARGVSIEEGRKRALEFHIPGYIALGLDPKKTVFYFQSENKEVMQFGYRAAKKITLNEFKAIYGNADPGRIMSAVTQVGDILFPQFDERMPGIIPVGIDQDPHIRLTRDVVNRMKSEKFFAPSSLYHKYTSSLDGSMKMSKSKPESCITVPEDVVSACKKLKKALTGGRETVDDQRKKGGQPEKCMVFEMHKQHLIEKDSYLQKIHDDCKSGAMLCGECKNIACEKMNKFMIDFNNKLLLARKNIKQLKFVEF
ncbi:MAG: tryptophan--tRNA ligase [Nanoarchaeota archaeon]|nr:tryptophan--tRNA ligase [Nanoarchaeota archaeon]MBU1030429.1 tryptophan--tRNA ligase [Nanoarchaeota archaeon]MBU1849788.1 tryptophan--tRNA ligase [Nanoarchaeota archaeon]